MRERTAATLFRTIPLSLMVILSAVVLTASCDTTTFVLGSLGEGEGGEAGATGDPESTCRSLGTDCDASSECCSGECIEGTCTIPVPSCLGLGQSCEGSEQCCSLSCDGGICAGSCSADGDDCATDDGCCSGICEGGSCASLNDSCSTAGNPCEDSAQCCSGLCAMGACSLRSSFCHQEGDVCRWGPDCCSQVCTLVEGESVGTCAPAPNGPSNCSSGIAGSLCEDCNDCCSRLCIPFGENGLHVCALAKGCRQTGELCTDDLDCCGGDADSGLPGAGNVTCQIDEGQEWGICRNAMSCSPQGNVCHLQNYACGVSSAANKCCGAEGEDGDCQLDGDGVPRCYGLGSTCLLEGDPCATSEDCCAGACRPSDDGGLTCQEVSECVELSASCTATSECCPGTWCARHAAEPFGNCSDEGAVECSLEGQICGLGEGDCCAPLECRSGRCRGAE